MTHDVPTNQSLQIEIGPGNYVLGAASGIYHTYVQTLLKAVNEAGFHLGSKRTRVTRSMTSTAVSLPPSATPTLVTQQLTFLPPALLTPSVEYHQTARPESAQTPMADQPPVQVHHGEPNISITFLLLSGKRKTISFDPEYTISKVRQEVFDNWPEGERSYHHIPFHNVFRFMVANDR